MNKYLHVENRILSALTALTVSIGFAMYGFGSAVVADEYATAAELKLMVGFPPSLDKRVDMDTYLKETYSDTLVVIKGDTIVYEKYDNGMTPNQPHQMMSVTKSLAGLMNLIAVENSKLKESDPVTKYLPELKDSAFDAIISHVTSS